MAVTNAQGFQIANEQAFQHRVQFLLVKAAVSVMAEDVGTTGHVERVAYADKVLSGTAQMLPVAIAVMTNPSIQAEASLQSKIDGDYQVPDGDMEFAVNSLFSALAGVTK